MRGPRPRPRPASARKLVSLALVGSLACSLACQRSLEDQLAEVRLLQELGAIDESIEGLREILATRPDHPEASLLLGTAQLAKGRAGLAIWPLQTAARSEAWAAPSQLALASAYLALQQHDQALRAADAAAAASPQDPEQRIAVARLRTAAYVAAERWDEAIEASARWLREVPGDPDALTLQSNAFLGAERVEEAREPLVRIWNDPRYADAPVAARAGIALARLHTSYLEDEAEARRYVEELMARHPARPDVLRYVVGYFDEREQPELGTDFARTAVRAAPADLGLRTFLAERLAASDRTEEAERLLVEATELLGTPQAWVTLAEFHRFQEEPAKALAALDQAVAKLPEVTDLLWFKRAVLLVATGDLEGAEAAGAKLAEAVYRDMLAAQLAFSRGDLTEAERLFDTALRRWPNNANARYLAGRTALGLGKVERAVSEFREAVRADPDATDAGLDLARIELARGDPMAAATGLVPLLNHAPPSSRRFQQAALLMVQIQVAQGHYEQARQALAKGPELDFPALDLAVARAALEAKAEGPAAAVAVLEASALDLVAPENEAALRMLCDHLIAVGRGADALARADAATAASLETPGPHDVRGRVLSRLGRHDEAEAAFGQALALDPEHAEALAGLAHLAEQRGDRGETQARLEQAAAAAPGRAEYPYRLAQFHLAAGRREAAVEAYEEALRRDPLHPHASNDLAWILAEQGHSLDRALALAQTARRVDPSAAVLDTLGWVRFKRGEMEQAVRVLGQARALDPRSPSIGYRLSLALMETGESERARELLEQAVGAGAFPEADAARDQLARLSRNAP